MRRALGYAFAIALFIALLVLRGRMNEQPVGLASKPGAPPSEPIAPRAARVSDTTRPGQKPLQRAQLPLDATRGTAGSAGVALISNRRDEEITRLSNAEERAASAYTSEALEEAGVTKKALYATRANLDWISIGKTLHEQGHPALADEAARLIALWSSTMQPYAPESLNAALAAERALVAKLRTQVSGNLKVRGSRLTLSANLERIEQHNGDAASGRGPSVAAKIREAQQEAEQVPKKDQRARKAYRPWASDPVENKEEVQDRQVDRAEEERAPHGIEAPSN